MTAQRHATSCASSAAPGAAGSIRFPPTARPAPVARSRAGDAFQLAARGDPGRRCLDLFAGSGALGLEALSRGAREVVFVDRDPRGGPSSRRHAGRLRQRRRDRETSRMRKRSSCARGEPFDIVFLDPPFDCGRAPELVSLLERTPGSVREGSCISRRRPRWRAAASGQWSLHRSKRAGEVGYHLRGQGIPATRRQCRPHPDNSRQNHGRDATHGHPRDVSGHVRPDHQRPQDLVRRAAASSTRRGRDRGQSRQGAAVHARRARRARA